MTEELEIFLEDCDDQLQMMEDALVDMQSNGASESTIGTIFRAVHTIKGSAGMFGFDDIVTFAHTGENLFDSIRQGDVGVCEEMISLFLLCKDHMEVLINLLTEDKELSAAQKEVGHNLIQRLEGYLPRAQIKEENIEDIPSTIVIEAAKWHISIRFHKDFFTTGMSINSVFKFFNKVGKVLKIQPIIYNIPSIEDINPLHPYIGFEVCLLADLSKSEVEDIFEFIQEDVDLYIFLCDDSDEYNTLVSIRKEPELKNELINAKFIDEDTLIEPELIIPTVEEKEEIVLNQKEEEIVLNQKEEEIVLNQKEEEEIVLNQKEEEEEIVLNQKEEEEEIVLNQKEEEEIVLNKKEESSEPKKKAVSSLRVDSSKIDILINYMSEISITNSRILTLIDDEGSEIGETVIHMKQLLEFVSDGIMDMRMVKVGDSFNKFRRIVSDTAKKIGKDVDFVISGEDTELDKTVVERISDPLLHMLRNSIDHGVELPEDRVACGKPAQGRVDLRAYQDSGTIVIEIEDNGKGLDRDRILAKAIENGSVKKNNNLSDSEIYKLIFSAGLSTAETVSAISGRGVGMDVVKRNIEDLRGSVEIESTIGQGSKITIRLPLTLAVIDGFLLQVGDTKYIIPLENIKECIELTTIEQESLNGNEFINVRGEVLPLLDIRLLLGENKSITERQNIVIVYFGKKIVGLLVDELLGEHQTVIKSLGIVFDQLSGISGASVLGSGEIALIFDVARLIELRNEG